MKGEKLLIVADRGSLQMELYIPRQGIGTPRASEGSLQEGKHIGQGVSRENREDLGSPALPLRVHPGEGRTGEDQITYHRGLPRLMRCQLPLMMVVPSLLVRVDIGFKEKIALSRRNRRDVDSYRVTGKESLPQLQFYQVTDLLLPLLCL